MREKNNPDKAADTSPEQKKKAVSSPIPYALSNKYVLINLVSVVMAIIAFMMGVYNPDISAGAVEVFCQAVSAELIMAGTLLAVNIALKRNELDYGMVRSGWKAYDPKLTGALRDVSSITVLFSAFAAVAAVFSELFLADEGELFAGDYTLFYTLCSASRAVTLFSVLCALTSPTLLISILSAQTAAISGRRGEEAMKTAYHASDYPRIMGVFRRTAAINTAAAFSIAVFSLINSVSTLPQAFKPSGLAVILAVLTVLSLSVPRNVELLKSDTPTPIYDKGTKSFITVNVIMYLVIAFFFLYSFPFRSVYTENVIQHDFGYYDNISEKVPLFSLPPKDETGLPLYKGLFVITALFALMEYMATILYDDNTFGDRFTGEPAYIIMAIFMIGFYCVVHALLYPAAMMNAIMWLVCFSISCLMLGVNLMRIIIIKRRSRIENNTEKK